MRFDVITLFPELFAPHLVHGVTRRAFESGQVDVQLWPLRDFGDPPHAPRRRPALRRRARDGAAGRAAGARPGGDPRRPRRGDAGAAGQLLADRRAAAPGDGRASSRPAPARSCSARRYEGIDQRFIDAHVDIELSLGDYVLSGGELPALALLDAVARLQPGVLGDARSHQQDSFSAGLLDCPHYSRPEVLRRPAARAVPPVLLSGNHAAIDALAARAVARADRRAPPRPDRRGRGRRACSRRPTRRYLARRPRQSYNFGFFDPLPRRSPAPATRGPLAGPPTADPARVHDRQEQPPWT